jgi:hypothetical protein
VEQKYQKRRTMQSIPHECLFNISSYLDLQSSMKILLINKEWNKFLTETDNHFTLFTVVQYKSILLQRKQELLKLSSHGRRINSVNSQLRTLELRDKKKRKLRLNRSQLIHSLKCLYIREIIRPRVKPQLFKFSKILAWYKIPNNSTESKEKILKSNLSNLLDYIEVCQIVFSEFPNLSLFNLDPGYLGELVRSILLTIVSVCFNLKYNLFVVIPCDVLLVCDKYYEISTLIRNFLMKVMNFIMNHDKICHVKNHLKLPLSMIVMMNDIELVNYFVDNSLVDENLQYRLDKVVLPEMFEWLYTRYKYSLRTMFLSVHNPLATFEKYLQFRQQNDTGQLLIGTGYLYQVLNNKLLSPEKVKVVQYLLTFDVDYTINSPLIENVSNFQQRNNYEILEVLHQYKQKFPTKRLIQWLFKQKDKFIITESIN